MRKIHLSYIQILALFLALSSVAASTPKMFMPEEKFDFGFVPQSSKISHVFWIKSVGSDSLKILNINPG
jgi:hypothetical protein